MVNVGEHELLLLLFPEEQDKAPLYVGQSG